MIATNIHRVRRSLFNRRHATKILSDRASLRARYGVGVLISPETVVADDVVIGDYSYVNRRSSVENCVIGRYTSISSGVYICPFEHDIHSRTQHPVGSNSHFGALKRPPVLIGNDVLISLNAIVLSGVHIGDGAVIGAGAVVTKDVEPFEIVAGVPAKAIGQRFLPAEAQALQQLAWWDWSRDRVLRNRSFLAGHTDRPVP